MLKRESVKAYIFEPVCAAFCLSVLVNLYGASGNALFMHEEARDILSLVVVLLGAALALWIGLFWVSNTPFGQWLAKRQMLNASNDAYIASTFILLCACVSCILCAHLSEQHTKMQLLGEFLCLSGLATIFTLLNNTRHLLRSHTLYSQQSSSVPELRRRGD